MSMTHDEMLAVIAAHRDGKQIEARARDASVKWYPKTERDFDFQHYDYRTKPEPPKPREWWIGCNEDESEGLISPIIHEVRQIMLPCGRKQIHVREVLETES